MRPRPPWLPLALLALASAAAPRAARADDVAEPSTGWKFPATISQAGKPYALTGLGVRKKFVVKVYAMALYADAAALKPRLASATEPKERWLAAQPIGKHAVLHFVRDVDAEKIQEAYKDGLEPELQGKKGPGPKKDAETFIALFDKELKSGQEIKLSTDESGQISVEIAGQKKQGPKDPRLCTAIWEIWLGPKPISTDLRAALASRLDSLK